MTTVSMSGFLSLKYIACLIDVLQQWPEQYGSSPSLSERWPAHWMNTTLFTSLPSDGRLIAPPFAFSASASRPAWSTTSGLLPAPR